MKQAHANAGALGLLVVFLQEPTTEFTFDSIIKFLFYSSGFAECGEQYKVTKAIQCINLRKSAEE